MPQQLRVKDLPWVRTWRLGRASNPQPFGRKALNLPMSHHVPHFFAKALIICDFETGDSELDIVQSPRSTIVIPHIRKATPILQASANSNPVCGQTADRCFEGVERNARPVFFEKVKSLSVEEGQCTRFTCQVKGQPTPSVHWEKDGRQVAGDKFKVSRCCSC